MCIQYGRVTQVSTPQATLKPPGYLHMGFSSKRLQTAARLKLFPCYLPSVRLHARWVQVFLTSAASPSENNSCVLLRESKLSSQTRNEGQCTSSSKPLCHLHLLCHRGEDRAAEAANDAHVQSFVLCPDCHFECTVSAEPREMPTGPEKHSVWKVEMASWGREW